MDHSLPNKLEIGYSKLELIINLSVGLVVFAVTLFLFNTGQNSNYILAILGLVASINIFWKYFPKFLNSTTKLTISDKGIESTKYGFISWNHIIDEDISRSGDRKYMFLTFEYSTRAFKGEDEDNYIQIDLDDLDITYEKIQIALKTYRNRYKKTNSQR